MQIEGHYDRGSTGDVWMEAFFTFKGPGATAAARPFFFAFDKETNEPLDISLAPGLGESLNLDFEDFTGGNVYRELTLTGTISVTLGETVTQATSGATGIVAVSGSTGSPSVLRVNHITGTFNTSNQLTGSVSGALGANSVPTAVGATQDGTNYEFSEGLLQINPKASATNFVTTLRLEAHEGFGSTFRMGTNGQTEMFKMNTGVSSTTGYMAIQMKDNAGTPDQKTGQFVLQAEPSNESIMCSIGGALASHSILNVTNASGTTAKKVLTLICIASQTSPAFEIDGIQDGGTAETDKFQIYPKGYISVKPSGGASSSPTAGSGGP